MTEDSGTNEVREDERVGDDELTPREQAQALYDSMSTGEKVKTVGVFLLSALGAFTVVRWGVSAIRHVRR